VSTYRFSWESGPNLTLGPGRARLALALGPLYKPLYKEPIMAMIYKQAVSVFANTKGELTVKPDVDGKWTHDNVVELYKTMQSLSKQHKMPIRAYKPDANGTEPVLLTDRYGKPYLALLSPSKAPSKAVVTKLA
jgi:hypothetical protein